MPSRPSFLVSTADVPEHAHAYPHSTESMGPMRRLGKTAGLVRIGPIDSVLCG